MYPCSKLQKQHLYFIFVFFSLASIEFKHLLCFNVAIFLFLIQLQSLQPDEMEIDSFHKPKKMHRRALKGFFEPKLINEENASPHFKRLFLVF